MRFAVPAVLLCAALMLASAVPVLQRSPVEVSVINDTAIKVQNDNIAVADDRAFAQNANNESDNSDNKQQFKAENDTGALPTEDRKAHDDCNGGSGDGSDALPDEDRMTAEQPQDGLATPDSSTNDKTTTLDGKVIPTVVRLANPQNTSAEDTVAPDLRTADREANDDSNGGTGDGSEAIFDENRMAADQPHDGIKAHGSSTDDDTEKLDDEAIPSVARVVSPQDSVEEDTETQETLSETERKSTLKPQQTNEPRKRYRKESQAGLSKQVPTPPTPKKTYTRPKPQTGGPRRPPNTRKPRTRRPYTRTSKTRKPHTSTPKTRAPKTRAPKTRAPKTRAPKTLAPKTRSPKTRPPKTREPKTREPKTRAPKTREPNARAPKTRAPKTRPPKSSPPQIRAPKTLPRSSEKTCPCRMVAKPTNSCYSFTNESKGKCKLRMCGAKWECVTNGNPPNICIRKFSREKIELIRGTNRCRRRKHAPKAYWVFYRKYYI